MKNKVAVVGAGIIDFGVLYDKSPDMMMEEAYLKALKSVDNGIQPQEIQAAWLGTLRGRFTGVTLAHPTGLFKIPVSRVENACATGNDAFRHACFAIAAGIYDTALVIGYEKMHDEKGGLIKLAAIKDIWMRRARTMPSFFALRATRHMHLYGSKKEDFALVSVKNRHNGALYPHAHFKKEVTLEQVMKAPIISWPLGLFDCCPTTDGAAAVIVCKAEIAKKYTDTPVYVAGSGLSVDSWMLGEDESLVGFPASKEASRQAYKMAGLEPKDIDVGEIHDCFSVTEILNYEDLGFCEKGQGHKLIQEGVTALDGEKPMNPSGGLLAKGHPIGATGVAQIAEIFEQLRGQAGKIQIAGAEVGLTHNIGVGRDNTGSVSCVHILTR
ncbi:MAG: thiolase family protein [Candidatus Freyarchaeota archaeon]|nr:thiolase family protein [Candidatus Jordarchaeia archaeon]MBS7270127.1 thiolase family protein [Candidatus Jordarchaeia archaeon]MBS7278608.1 thiolase family protein [Candidatus Jordarchaeia archaeon]